MSKDYLAVKSELGKAKNLGSAVHGSHHWLMQRLTAVLMIPLCFWAVYFLNHAAKVDYNEIISLMKHPWNLCPMLLILTTGLYHGMLGMQVVIEDYISCLKTRYFLIIALMLFTFVTIFTLIVTTIYFLIHS